MNTPRTQARMRARTSPHAGLHPARQACLGPVEICSELFAERRRCETASVSSPHGDRQKHAGWLVFAEVGSCEQKDRLLGASRGEHPNS